MIFKGSIKRTEMMWEIEIPEINYKDQALDLAEGMTNLKNTFTEKYKEEHSRLSIEFSDGGILVVTLLK